jgi:hypothetical protein
LRGVNLSAQDTVVMAVALVAAAGNAYLFVVGTLDQDRRLFLSAAVAFFAFSLVGAVFFLRAM